MPELINETEDLINLRRAHTGDHVTELDKSLEVLVECVSLRARVDGFSSDESSFVQGI